MNSEKSSDTEKLAKIEEILKSKNNGHCLCGAFESCEYCSGFSQYNKLIAKLENILHPEKPFLTFENYGRAISIDIDLMEK